VLQNSIEALQGEMRSMRDEMRVMRAQLDGLPSATRRPARREAEMTDDNTAINTSFAELRASVADLQRDIVLIKDVLGRLDRDQGLTGNAPAQCFDRLVRQSDKGSCPAAFRNPDMASAKGCELLESSNFPMSSIAIAIPAAVARPRPLPQGPPTGLTGWTMARPARASSHSPAPR
jgi:hypothetical protein